MPKVRNSTRPRRAAPSSPAAPSASTPRRRRTTATASSATPTAAQSSAAVLVDPAQLRDMVTAAVREAVAVQAAPAPSVAATAMPSEVITAAAPPPLPTSPPVADLSTTGTSPRPVGAPFQSEPVAAAVRHRIVSDQYVDLGTLLDGTDQAEGEPAPSYQLVAGLLRPVSRSPRAITTFGLWCSAFIRLAGVYIEAHPAAAAGLLAHMRQVCQLTAPGLGFAWRDFDVAFRKAREQDPTNHPWGETASSSPLWLQAVARGIGGATGTSAHLSRAQVSGRFRRVQGHFFIFMVAAPAWTVSELDFRKLLAYLVGKFPLHFVRCHFIFPRLSRWITTVAPR